MKTKAASIRLLALAATLLLGCSAAHAQSFLYNVDSNDADRNNNAADTFSGAAVLGHAGDFWNGVFGSATLQGATAGAPPISFSYSGEAVNGFNMGGTTARPLLLMQDYFYQSAGESASLTLSGLTPGAAYTLVLYGAGDAAGQGSTFNLTGGIGGNSASTLLTSGADRDISNGVGDAYNTFTGTVGPGGSLTVNIDTNDLTPFAVFNGLQLEVTPVPEPATWLVGALLLGGVGLTMRQRCRVRRACAAVA